MADGKKLFLWREVLVLMDRSPLPEGSVSKSLYPWWEGSATIFPARLRILEVYRSWSDGRLQPTTFSADKMTRCSPPLSLAGGSSVPDGGDGGGEDGLNDGGVEVHHHCPWQVEFLQLSQEVHPLLGFLDEGADVQLPLEVLGDDGSQKAEGLHSVNCGVTEGDGGR